MPIEQENLNIYVQDETCTSCNGHGKIHVTITSQGKTTQHEQTCHLCNGTGTIKAGTVTVPISD